MDNNFIRLTLKANNEITIQEDQEKILENEAYKECKFGEVISHYERAIKLNPSDMTNYANILAVFFRQKRYLDCISMSECAIDIVRKIMAELAHL